MGQKLVEFALGSTLKRVVRANVTLSISAPNASRNRTEEKTAKNHRNRTMIQNLGLTAVVKETYLITMN